MDPSVKEGESYQMIPFFSKDMLYRVLFIALGAIIYFALSCCMSVPEPEDLLQAEHFDVVLGDAASTPLSSKDSISSTTEIASLVSCDSASSSSETDHDSPPHNSRKPNQNLKGRLIILSNDSIIVDTVPPENSSEIYAKWARGGDLESAEQKKAWRVAILMFVSMLVHNFPEGLAIAVSALESEKLGITVTIGMMIHNIPEGIAIAIPCLAARPDKPWIGFALASLSGLAEPIGAFVALLFLQDTVKEEDHFYMVYVLAFVAGIMIMVAIWELLPEALEHSVGDRSAFWMGTISGVVVMGLTELYLP